MKIELFPFQRRAVAAVRSRAAAALGARRSAKIPQVISLQAPTGAGKTIIMAELIEEIFYGTELDGEQSEADGIKLYSEQPEAIFVWLSDSPALNEQSRRKLERVADRIRVSQFVTIEDASFDQEMLDDGHVYFLNTQKLGKAGNLGRHSDRRQYTIWETLENTAQNKSDRLYFIIDEAHRGMQGQEAARATSVMQRFLKGHYAPSGECLLSPMPLVIGISATSKRFEALVTEQTQSVIAPVVVRPEEVRESGLLKDRIIITYPDDATRNNGWTVLQAATDEWLRKCERWEAYCKAQGREQVNPAFVVQVESATADSVSATDLGELLSRVESRMGRRFSEWEVVHTFGSTDTQEINGLPVHHINPSDIAGDKRARLIFFKESLSVGWDCPRAETMLSFCRRQDATYIAQLLGRMVRTPLQGRVLSDESLNEVRLFLPAFEQATVQSVIDELQNTEGGELPTALEEEELGHAVYRPWGTRVRKQVELPDPDQQVLYLGEDTDTYGTPPRQMPGTSRHAPVPTAAHPQSAGVNPPSEQSGTPPTQLSLKWELNRDAIIRFINKQAFLSYIVKTSRSRNYLSSMLRLTALLTRSGIYPESTTKLRADVVGMIRNHVEALRRNGRYNELAKKVMELKLRVDVFDIFGESVSTSSRLNLFSAADAELERQLRVADAKLGGYGFSTYYGQKYCDMMNPHGYMVDVILFAADEGCLKQLNEYARTSFHSLNNNYRRYIVTKSEDYRRQYRDIIAAGDEVSEDNFYLPETIMAKSDSEGRSYTNHLFVDADTGCAQIKLNNWEEAVIDEESGHPDFVCWLRNIPRTEGSLCIPYRFADETKAAYPDFIIVRRDTNPAAVLPYVIDILEPHSPAFNDNLAKAKGFAEYAAREARVGRFQLIRESKDDIGHSRFRRLDFTNGQVRDEVRHARSNDDLDHIFEKYAFAE